MKKNISLHAPAFFLLLLLNALASYGPFPMGIKMGLGLAAAAAFGIFLKVSPVPSGTRAPWTLSWPGWVLVLLGVLALFLRFNDLTTFSLWPHYDEGATGFYAAALSQKWNGRLFYEASQTPPAYLWGLGLFFKVFGVSLSTLWAFPALLSVLTLPAAYLAARAVWPKDLSRLAVLLMAFSFWPLFTGRFSLMAVLVLLWECLALYGFGRFGKASPARRGPEAFFLGIVMGLGFYTGWHWVMLAVLLLVGLAPAFRRSPKTLAWFAPPFLVLALPLLGAAYLGNGGQYFRHLWAFEGGLSPARQIAVSLSYISSLFWGLPRESFTFQPVFGGFLNPVLSSFFLLGLLEVARRWKEPFIRWLALGLVLLLLPGLLTKECEPFRVLPILPFLLAVAVLGVSRLGDFLPKKSAPAVLAALWVLSSGLDLYHLQGRYHRLWDSTEAWRGYAKSFERYRAFQLLQRIETERGPGWVFSNFTPGLCDQTLSVADSSFNAVEDRGIPQERVQWAAVLANVNVRPFLDKRFSGARAFALSSDSRPSDGGWMLWVVPLNPGNRPAFSRWLEADRSLALFIDESLSNPAGRSFERALPALDAAYPSFQGDPFLSSSYLEKMSDLFLKESLRGRPDEGALLHAARLLEKAAALQPSAHLYNHLGNLWLIGHNEREARKAFQKAVQAPIDLTDSADALASLERRR